MTAQCPSCGCHQPEGLLCWQDTEAVLTMLAAVPALVDQLDVAASKQAKISSGGKAGKGTAHLKEPVNWGAAAARDALLVEWALWHDSIEEIRRHPKAAEIVAGIGRVVKNGYQAIDRAGDRKYLGTCGATIEASTPEGRRPLLHRDLGQARRQSGHLPDVRLRPRGRQPACVAAGDGGRHAVHGQGRGDDDG
jgi:hypothetical protein